MNTDSIFGQGFTIQAAKYSTECSRLRESLVQHYPRVYQLKETDPLLYQVLLSLLDEARWVGFCDGYDFFSPTTDNPR